MRRAASSKYSSINCASSCTLRAKGFLVVQGLDESFNVFENGARFADIAFGCFKCGHLPGFCLSTQVCIWDPHPYMTALLQIRRLF